MTAPAPPPPVHVGRYWRCGSCRHVCAGRENHHYRFDPDSDTPGTRTCAICGARCPEGSILTAKALQSRAKLEKARERRRGLSPVLVPGPAPISGAFPGTRGEEAAR